MNLKKVVDNNLKSVRSFHPDYFPLLFKYVHTGQALSRFPSSALRDSIKKTNYRRLLEKQAIQDGKIVDSGEYQSFSDFAKSIEYPHVGSEHTGSMIQFVYKNYEKRIPQQWRLIDPQIYGSALASVGDPALHAKREEFLQTWVLDSVEAIKFDAAQFIANSFLTSGPMADFRTEDTDGYNLSAKLWFSLTGDPKLDEKARIARLREKLISFDLEDEFPKYREELSKELRHTLFSYIQDFSLKYLKSDPFNGTQSLETDGDISYIVDLIASFDEKPFDWQAQLVIMNKIIDIVHGRGSLAHLFVKGGDDALDKIAGYKKNTAYITAGLDRQGNII